MRQTSTQPTDKLHQPGIFDGVPPVARFVLFNLADAGIDAAAIKAALARLAPLVNGKDVVVGAGRLDLRRLGLGVA